jgi:methyl-accepting chemotaxis protein
MTDMAEKGSDFLKDLGDAARRNPMSAALIGMGIVWLFAGGKAGVGPGDLLERTGMDRMPGAAKDTLKTARESVASATNSAADTIREVGSAGIETASRLGSEYGRLLPDSANVLDNVRNDLTDLFKAQPLALGAIGLAIGAGIAAALPNTDLENSYLGETSESVRSKAAEIAGQQIDKAATVASDVVDAAKDGARKEGLTLDDAKGAMDGLSGKLGRVVDAAGKSLSENLR